MLTISNAGGIATRGHNEGSISSYSHGRVVVRVTMRDGSRRSKTIRGSDQRTVERAARDELRKLLALRDGGFIGHDLSLGRFLTKWLGDVRPKVAPATYRQWEGHVDRYLVPELGRVKVSDLRVHDVEAMLGRLAIGPQTKRHVRSTLRRALRDAQRNGLAVANVAALAAPPAMPVAERQVLDADQAKALLAAAGGHRLSALFVLALHTGARQAELLGLRWNDVDGDFLHIRRTLQRVWTGELSASGRKVNKWVFLPPKTDRSRRSVHLTPAAVAALRAHRERQAQERGALSTDGLVFTTPGGLPIHGSNVTPVLRELLAAAGCPQVTFHDLRHSSATLLYAMGVPLETIADILGHSTPRITAQLYRHRVPKLQRDAVERLAAALG